MTLKDDRFSIFGAKQEEEYFLSIDSITEKTATNHNYKIPHPTLGD